MATARPILVGVDGSSDSLAALIWARRMARAEDMPLVVVYVLSGTGPRQAERLAFKAIAQGMDADEVARVEGRRLVESLRHKAGPAAPSEEVRVEVGDPATVLLGMADQAEAEAIVVGAKGQGRLGRALFGSVAHAVASRAQRPVITVHGSVA